MSLEDRALLVGGMSQAWYHPEYHTLLPSLIVIILIVAVADYFS